jgi:hypothetical protein
MERGTVMINGKDVKAIKTYDGKVFIKDGDGELTDVEGEIAKTFRGYGPTGITLDE